MILQPFMWPTIEAALADTPVVLLNGPRQSGKSTLARHFAETLLAARYLTLDDAATLAAATRRQERLRVRSRWEQHRNAKPALTSSPPPCKSAGRSEEGLRHLSLLSNSRPELVRIWVSQCSHPSVPSPSVPSQCSLSVFHLRPGLELGL